MPRYTIETPRGARVTLEADDESAAIMGAQTWDYEDFAIAEAERLGINAETALRMMKKESSGNPAAVSPKGARGLMQLMPETAKEMGVDPDDPYQNISGGLSYFKRQLDDFGGDEQLALAAYNAGPSAVRRHGGVPPFAETQNYVRTLASPREVGTSQNRGVTIELLPDNGPATIPMKKGKPEASEALGFMKGVVKPLDNAAIFLEGGLERLGVPTKKINEALGMPSAAGAAADHAEYVRAQAQKGVVPGKLGEFGGNVLGTLPTALIPGGVVAQGAASGALLSDNLNSAGGIGRDMAYGAIGGKIGDVALKGLGKVVSGVTDPMVRTLINEGVPLTPGQLAGGAVRRLEDAATSIPLVGDVIKGAQRRSIEGLNKAAINRTLKPIGEELPANLPAGRDAVAYAGDRLSAAYDDILPSLAVKADKTFVGNVKNLRALAANMPTDQAKMFDNLLDAEVLGRFSKSGGMTGSTMKEVESVLGREVSDFLASASPHDRRYAEAVRQLQQELREMVKRSNPQAAQRLSEINAGWANLKRVEAAAAGAGDEVFTPARLQQGVKANASKRQFARGEAAMQDLADAGRAVLPSTVPESGTAARSMVALLGGGALAGANIPMLSPALIPSGALLSLYTKTGQKLAELVAASRPQVARDAARQIPKLKAPAVAAGSAAAVNSRK